jgi:hypothetical protein
MPCPSINLEPYKAEIIDLFKNNILYSSLTEFLSDQYGVEVQERTIRSRL